MKTNKIMSIMLCMTMLLTASIVFNSCNKDDEPETEWNNGDGEKDDNDGDNGGGNNGGKNGSNSCAPTLQELRGKSIILNKVNDNNNVVSNCVHFSFDKNGKLTVENHFSNYGGFQEATFMYFEKNSIPGTNYSEADPGSWYALRNTLPYSSVVYKRIDDNMAEIYFSEVQYVFHFYSKKKNTSYDAGSYWLSGCVYLNFYASGNEGSAYVSISDFEEDDTVIPLYYYPNYTQDAFVWNNVNHFTIEDN